VGFTETPRVEQKCVPDKNLKRKKGVRVILHHGVGVVSLALRAKGRNINQEA